MGQRLIDADAIEFPDANYWEETHEDEDYGYGMGVGDCIEIIEKMPTIDAVQVIRCKECKYRDEETANCTRFRKDWYVQSNSFCSWAEPKVNDDNS